MQDDAGQPKEVTSDDYASVQLKLVPADRRARIARVGQRRGRRARAHMLMNTKGKARVDNQIIISGTQGALIIGINNGCLIVQDAGGQVGGPLDICASLLFQGLDNRIRCCCMRCTIWANGM